MPKQKFQIKNRYTNEVIIEMEAETFKEVVIKNKANLRKADLWGADLRKADLWEADLWEADLREADLWEAKGLQLYWHIHHDQLVENLTEPLKNRIDYIKKEKSKDEIKLRLKLFKKVKCKPKDWPITKEGWEKLHKIECGCGWNGQTILTKKNGYLKSA